MDHLDLSTMTDEQLRDFIEEQQTAIVKIAIAAGISCEQAIEIGTRLARIHLASHALGVSAVIAERRAA